MGQNEFYRPRSHAGTPSLPSSAHHELVLVIAFDKRMDILS
jgi:hypothetical protein